MQSKAMIILYWLLGITLAAPLFKKASAIQIKITQVYSHHTCEKALMERVC